MITNASIDDASTIASIYNHYVEHTIITFETECVLPQDIAQRIAQCQREGLPWLVAKQNHQVIGYAYASKWKGRCAYQFSVEATVYLDKNITGKGWGTKLYQALMQQLADKQFHAVICGIALPNEASVALHEKLGMTKVAHFKEVGRKFEKWIDVGYWQLLLKATAQ